MALHIAGNLNIRNFPRVSANNLDTSQVATQMTSPVFTLPTGIVANDLIFFSISGPTLTPITIDVTGYNRLYLSNTTTGGFLGLFYKLANGSDGTTVTATSNVSGRFAAGFYTIKGWNSSITPQVTGVSNGTSGTTIDPPALTPTWANTNTLYITTGVCRSGATTPMGITAYPTNYTQNTQNVGAGSATIPAFVFGMAARQFRSTTDDPGTFTSNIAGTTLAVTVAISP